MRDWMHNTYMRILIQIESPIEVLLGELPTCSAFRKTYMNEDYRKKIIELTIFNIPTVEELETIING